MHIIFNLIQILFAIIAVAVCVSYLIRRYEIGNRERAETAGGRTASAVEVALGVAGEIVAVFVSVLLYPLGFIMKDTAYSTLRRGERPIILCHGYMHNKSAFLLMARRLRRAGRNNVLAINFGPPSEEAPHFARRLVEAVNSALVYSGCEKVDLIGHSMGGLVVRYYVEKLDGAPSVNRAITLGAPNRGTKTAALGLFRSAGQFRPTSSLIKGFEEQTGGADQARMVSIWSDFDSVVLPPENARLPEPYENVMIRGVGHVALLYSGRVFEKIKSVLETGSPQQEPTNGVA